MTFNVNVPGKEDEKTGKITGEVNLNLKQQKISAKLNYDYIAAGGTETEIQFYLNEKFNVSRVKCDKCQSFNFDRKAERFPTLTIVLNQPLPTGKRLPIEIEYDGDITQMYHKEYNFLELGLDWFWYPVHRNIGQFNFYYRLHIKTDDPSFQLVGNGRTTRKGKNWLIESKVADRDIDVVLSDKLDFKTYHRNGYYLQVVSKNLSEETPGILLENIRETLDFYNSTFGAGNLQREVTAVFRPFPKGDIL